MEQHPVPQNISSYQFHLVGDMTLKQFLEIAGGVLIGVVIYATGLPAIIKWPLILFFVAMGAALAFVPLQERPLERWIFAFFRSIYSPTLFHWEKREQVKYFADETAVTADALPTPNQQATSNIPFLKKLEESESNYLNKLGSIFNPTTSQPQAAGTTNEPKGETVITVPVNLKPVDVQPFAQPVVTANNTSTNLTATAMPSTTGNILTMHTDGNGSGQIGNPGRVAAGQKDIQIPQTTFISLNNQDQNQLARPQVVVQEMPASTGGVNLTQTNVSQTLSGREVQNVQQAQFSTDAAPPSVPEIKNTVSGQVVSSDMKIIDGAILEILDTNGRPVRALRTNQAGHFLIVTPLEKGKYTIVAEKEGFNFDPVAFEASDAIIQPIAIKAK